MIRILLASTMLAITAPAAAQMAPVQPASPSPDPSAPGTTTQPGPAQSGATAQPAAPATTASAVASIVDSEFPAYDTNSDGMLDQNEFSRWMIALKTQEAKTSGTVAQDMTAWVNGAFTTADKDKNVTISKVELIAYLSGGAA